MAQAPTDPSSAETADPEESSPNMIVYRKIEDIVTRMQDDKTGGVPIRTVKSFLSKIPSVVTEFLWAAKHQIHSRAALLLLCLRSIPPEEDVGL